MEAFWTRFNPTFLEIYKKIQNGDIGEENTLTQTLHFLQI